MNVRICCGLDLDVHIADAINVIKWERLSDVVLCGHSYSYGGFVISGGCRTGRGPHSLNRVPRCFSSEQRRRDRGHYRAPRPAAAFGVNEADRAWVDALCVPQPIGTFTSPIRLTGARDRIARKTYIRAKSYANPAFDRAFAAVQSDRSWRSY